MTFTETRLGGVYLIEPEKKEDARGFFARTFSREEFEAHGLMSRFVQCNISVNPSRGTLRGMHYQIAPYEEAKLITCVRGAVFDAVIDLRLGSPTYRHWFATELSAENITILYVPGGCAHGFQTLRDDTAVFYQMSEFYHPECARGVRWNDPAFGIPWPFPPEHVSERDAHYPLIAEGSTCR